eukprot:3371311-Rhodomonas_salina.3
MGGWRVSGRAGLPERVSGLAVAGEGGSEAEPVHAQRLLVMLREGWAVGVDLIGPCEKRAAVGSGHEGVDARGERGPVGEGAVAHGGEADDGLRVPGGADVADEDGEREDQDDAGDH